MCSEHLMHEQLTMASVATKEAIKRFMESKGGKYPYSSVMSTRSNFHTRWLLVRTKEKDTRTLNKDTNCFAMFTACLPQHTVMELIISYEAFPMTIDMCEVLDAVHTWGRCRYHPGWYEKCLKELWHHCECNEEITKENLFKACIDDLLHLMYNNTRHFVQVWRHWRKKYHDEFYKACNGDFVYIVNKSVYFVREKIDELYMSESERIRNRDAEHGHYPCRPRNDYFDRSVNLSDDETESS